ncbi:MAG TPA: metabolite traffic protein EboE [Geminicoccaceae bacterium]|nr:metabolite traffic protein EboE [Geminicoccaceae bacterium]
MPGLPGDVHLTYCTNIHAGESWPDIRASLAEYLPAIKREVCPDGERMGVGLRLSGIAADALAEPAALDEFRDFLDANGLYVFTLNAFPYGPFHGTRVKEEVYQPDWRHDERLRFTNLSADILAALLPPDEPGLEGSVSTVPGTFKPLAREPGAAWDMAGRMVRHAAHLVRLRRRTGRTIALAIEPEPACFIETVEETVAFFGEHLFGPKAVALLSELTGLGAGAAGEALRRHLGVCYDACHAAVEFEDPEGGLRRLAEAGVRVTKLQLSSALRLPEVDPGAEELLTPFNEGVYLHQVVQRSPGDGGLTRYADLPQAFEALRRGEGAGGEWRVHCHVPIFLERFGALASTQDFLQDVLALCRREPVSAHLEAETYTWDVLPEGHRGASKAAAIARELAWVRDRLQP